MLINTIRFFIADILNIVLVNKSFLFINLWHVVHFFAGVYVMKFVMFFKLQEKFKKSKYLILLVLLAIYEVFELIFIIFNIQLFGAPTFKQESFIDVFYDLVFGMIGGFVAHFRKKT